MSSYHQQGFNAEHSKQTQAAMLLMMLGCDDSDIEKCKLADHKPIDNMFAAIIDQGAVQKFLDYLRG
jgi:hypothetical protein